MNGEGFIDRSKVRILLCDNDAKSSEHVFTLLINCSYQVTAVKSARQVIDALNAEGPDIDIILAEVDLPMAKGMKMLKYITRDKDLQRIPVIMMSAQDEVSIVVKCLRLGAADYLVKPLRTNELLNLWIHMWRRRHLLGLEEKNVIIYDLDVVGSDPSDANTTSTTLLSDDTDDRSRKSINPEIGMSNHHEETAADPVFAVAAQPPVTNILGYRPCVPGISDRRTGQCSLSSKKSELRFGDSSSAFFTYVKSSTQPNDSHEPVYFDKAAVLSPMIEDNVHACIEQEGYKIPAHKNSETPDKSSQVDDLPISNNHIPDSQSKEEECHAAVRQRIEPHVDISNFHAHMHSSYQYYMHGMMNQVMMPSPSSQIYQENCHLGLQNHANSAMVTQYTHFPNNVPGIGAYPFYPVNMLQQSHVPSSHQWPYGHLSSPEVKVGGKVDRREAALIKFRQKRKERCFDKKIRYMNRKKLAERRPRVRGQFVRKNGVNVDLNGQPNSGDFDDDEENENEDDVDQASRDSSPEDYN